LRSWEFFAVLWLLSGALAARIIYVKDIRPRGWQDTYEKIMLCVMCVLLAPWMIATALTLKKSP
jgi:hypothetical protein